MNGYLLEYIPKYREYLTSISIAHDHYIYLLKGCKKYESLYTIVNDETLKFAINEKYVF